MTQQNTEIPPQVVGLFDGDTDPRPVMVSIRCITYNHEPYIRQTLEGFVMQKTNFRFEAIVHDDASTDGTAAIIREYAEKYPDIIRPILETENQYSKRDGSLSRIMNATIRGKYVAWCEGDDYWTDPYKLQKQVDFLEAHPEYSMVFTNCLNLERSGKNKPHNAYMQDCDSPIEDIILKNGSFVPTPTIICRADAYLNMPQEVRSLYVGDYPLQIYMAHIGKVRYFHDVTAVYRINSIGSWTERIIKSKSLESKDVRFRNEMRLISVLDHVTDHQYSRIFKQYSIRFSWNYYREVGDLKNERRYFFKLKHPLEGYNFKAYIYLILKYCGLIKNHVK